MRRAFLVLLLLSGLVFAGEAGATEVIAHDDQPADPLSTSAPKAWTQSGSRPCCGPHRTATDLDRPDRHRQLGRASQDLRQPGARVLQPRRHCRRSRADGGERQVAHDTGITSIARPPWQGSGRSPTARVSGGARMAQLFRLGTVARNYILGWSRSIAEIFAEDTPASRDRGHPHGIGWGHRTRRCSRRSRRISASARFRRSSTLLPEARVDLAARHACAGKASRDSLRPARAGTARAGDCDVRRTVRRHARGLRSRSAGRHSRRAQVGRHGDDEGDDRPAPRPGGLHGDPGEQERVEASLQPARSALVGRLSRPSEAGPRVADGCRVRDA